MSEIITARRGFLRGLLALPLIGGGVTLIGQPTAAAVPVTPELMTRYCAWLARELGEALVERDVLLYPTIPDIEAFRRDAVDRWPQYNWPEDPVAVAAARSGVPSQRAAVVLGAAGCHLP
ncbi:hypothetical protein K9U40_14675 [Xanthobacter autotrophicus]|uniref:hypothetical protein n=1 Tax=Xanthobacter TaxID=279 RepID=UPI0024ABCD68|nr:hypothetical protein [Xanthobacter autotrophicus]MDI4665558.1 hypothetical protein [Xanthobacter autotrophicus]